MQMRWFSFCLIVMSLALSACRQEASQSLPVTQRIHPLKAQLVYQFRATQTHDAPLLIKAFVAGRVGDLQVKKNLLINTGDQLLSLSPESIADSLNQADVRYLSAYRQWHVLQLKVKRLRYLKTQQLVSLDYLTTSAQQLINHRPYLESKQRDMQHEAFAYVNRHIVSPQSGKVAEVYVHEGDYVKVGAPLLTIVATHPGEAMCTHAYVKLSVKLVPPPFLAGRAQHGAVLSDEQVSYLCAAGQDCRRAYLNAKPTFQDVREVMLLPASYVKLVAGAPIVRVQTPSGIKTQRIRLSYSLGEYYVVESGIESDDWIVV